jgi:trigger factor
MKVTQGKLPDSQIGLEIEITPEVSRKTYDKVVNDLMRNTNIPGFRKGKVPRQILIQRFGKDRIKATALEELIQDNLKKAVEQEAIESLGNYNLISKFEDLLEKYQPGEALTFSASVDVPPTVTLGDYQNLTVKAEEFVYQPEKVDEFIKEKQEKLATLIPVENRPAQTTDVAIIDYYGKFVGETEVISGVEGTEFQVELIEGQLVEGMVEGIVGMNLGDIKDITVTFPKDYARQDLASREVVFTITLQELKEKELPELDDDFASEVSEFETIQELRESLEKRFKEQAEEQTKNGIHSSIVDELIKQTEFDLPNTLIQDEINSLLTESAIQMQQMGIDVNRLFTAENIPKMRERTKPEAVERLKQNLVLSEICTKESLSPTEEEIKEKIKEIKENYPDQDYDLDKLKNFVTDDLKKEKTLNFIQEKATIELVPEGTLNPPVETPEVETPEMEDTEAENAETENTQAES